MGEQRAVAEAHERVDDRGRVDDDLDPIVREPEEPVCLDHLEPLVRERCRVHRDLRSHRPGWMSQRVGDGHRGEVGRASARGTGRPRPSARASGRCPARGPRGTGRSPSARCRPGSSAPPPRACAASASSPAATRLSLFASASVTPCSSAQSVARTPAKPTIALRTTSGCDRSSSVDRVAPDLDVLDAARARRRRRAAASPTAARRARARGRRRRSRSPGGRSSPVAPRSATRVITSRQHGVVRGRDRPEQRVDPVEHAAVARRAAGPSP